MPAKSINKSLLPICALMLSVTSLAWSSKLLSVEQTKAPLVRDGGVIAGSPECKFRNYFWPKHEIQMATPNTKLFVGATLNADFYWVRHAETLSNDFKEDEHRQFRQRSDFYFVLQHGINNEQERSTVDVRVNLANTMFMRTNARKSWYSPNSSTNIVGSRLDENFSPIRVNFKEAWVKINFDRLAKRVEKNPLSLKIGYFPFMVGRGIALGDSYHGGISYMGFNKTGNAQYAPSYPPGFLWSGEVGQYSSYSLYFSPLVIEDITAAKAPRITQVALPDESLLNRHIFAASFRLGSQFKDLPAQMVIREGTASVNPYWVYYNSPRQTVERAADAPITLHTFGFMAEIQAGGFEFNCEVAKQFGRQTVRERVYADPSNSNLYPSVQHFDPETGKFRPLPASILAQLPAGSPNPNRWFPNDNNAANVVAPAEAIYWNQLPSDRRLAEYHPGYDLKLEGWMAIFDARYSFTNYPLIVAAAAGYFSGDSYPYNDAVDQHFARRDNRNFNVSADGAINLMHESQRPYRGFVALRDYDYSGLWVYPMVMVNAGIMPRPKQLDLFDLSARNDTDSLTNLFYLGAGLTVRPLADRKKLRLNANALAYWLDDSLKKWDKKATPPAHLVQNEGVTNNGIAAYDLFNIQGWQSDETASRYLGWELNGVANYEIAENLELSLRGGIFFPGQVFIDLDGQPNDNTLIEQQNILDPAAPGAMYTKVAMRGLGQDKAYGFYLRIRYVF